MIPKYRAWDKENKEMLNVDVIDFYLEEIRVLEDDGSVFSMKFKDITLMQSTGLKDKNGKEIFEGDIVREFGNDYTPIYTEGIYMALNIEQLKLDKNLWSYSTQFNVVWRDGCEIKGNIYENPELMEE